LLSLLRRNRAFAIFAVTQNVSNLGDAVSTVAVPLYLLQLTRSPALAAALGIVHIVPAVALQLPLGALVDRWDRRRTLLWADVGRGLITLAIPVTAILHGPVVPVLFATAVPLGALSALFAAGFGAITPGLVGRDRVEQAYALTEGGESLAWVLGPVVAGVLVTAVGGPIALAVDGASFLVSAAGLAAIQVPRAGPAAERGSLWGELAGGLRFLVTNRTLRGAQAAWTLYGVLGFGVVLGLVAVGSGGGPGGARLASLAVAAYAAGSLAGTLLAGWRRLPRPSPVIAGCLAVFAAGAVLVATGAEFAVLAGGLLFGLSEGYFLITWLTIRAEATPDALMGRITAAGGLLGQAATAVGVGWMGLALQVAGGPVAFSLLAVLVLALAGWVALARPVPAPAR
jgi:MFS transporter, ENTS family, enterobactin (siderophore) exporter